MKRLGITSALLLSCIVSPAQRSTLYRIVQDNKIGYIDSTGSVRIPAIYHDGGDFSDGMAAVREQGLYGYIDTKGNYVIPPRFTRATTIRKNIGFAYIGQEATFINAKGEPIPENTYTKLQHYAPGKLLVTTASGKSGILDRAGKKLLIDTLYTHFDPSGYKSIIVTDKAKGNTGTIDSMGHTIIPFGKYEFIESFSEGYAWATLKIKDHTGKDDIIHVLIDESGKEILRRAYSSYNGNVSEGIFRVRVEVPDSLRGDNYDNSYYQQFYDLSGNGVYLDTACHGATDFSSGRAFIRTQKSVWHMVDHSFRILFTDTLDDIHTRFSGPYAIVTKNGNEALLDTNGKYIIEPVYKKLDISSIDEGFYFFGISPDGNSDSYYDDNLYWGIADLQGHKIMEPIMNGYEENGYRGALLRAVINRRLSYIDRTGNIVWQQQKKPATILQSLNMDYMNRGYCYAREAQPFYTGHRTGYAVLPQPLKQGIYKPNAISATLDADRIDTFYTNIAGYPLTIANTTSDTINFSAQDSRLYIKLQALDSSGQWADIEYLPSSWCGNSYHTLQLLPQQGWTFTVPQYEGAQKTRIRAQLEVMPKYDRRKKKYKKPDYVYSNEIEASVNPGQFFLKEKYTPEDFMDPYND